MIHLVPKHLEWIYEKIKDIVAQSNSNSNSNSILITCLEKSGDNTSLTQHFKSATIL